MNDQIKNNWWKFHNENPKVWELFVQYASIAINKGKKRCSSRMIIERIRWDVFIETTDTNSPFKINNNYSPYYARYFMLKYPKHDGFFELRERQR